VTSFRRARAELLKGQLVQQTVDRYSLSDVGHMFRANKGQTGAMAPLALRGQKGPVREGPLAPANPDGPEEVRAKPEEDDLPW